MTYGRRVFGLAVLVAVGVGSGCGGDDDIDGAVDDAGFVTLVDDDGAETPEAGSDEAGSDEAGSDEAGSDQADSDEAVDVCSIVSVEQAAETLGRPVLEGVASVDNFTDSSCEFVSEDEFGEISVEVRAGDPERFTEYYELTGGEPVEGVGDRAKWDDIHGLEVLTSDYYVGVFTINFDEDEAVLRERSITLAQAVLDRLP